MFLITDLARQLGLSRSTLLYYDRIGLLSPSGRSQAGYRLYSAADRERLEAICSFRQSGLRIADVRRILASAEDNASAVMQQRLIAVGREIQALQTKQRLLAGMLKLQSGCSLPEQVDKQAWVEMLRAAGMDDQAMDQWHREFERRTPEAHHAFLLSLGIEEAEALRIRRRSAERARQEG